MYRTVIRCSDSKRLHLVFQKAECFDIRQVLPICWVHIMCIGRIPLHTGDGQCEKSQDVEKSEESETPERFLEEAHVLGAR